MHLLNKEGNEEQEDEKGTLDFPNNKLMEVARQLVNILKDNSQLSKPELRFSQ